MAREHEFYRDNLEAVLEFTRGTHLMTSFEVARYCNIDYRTAKKMFFKSAKYISAESFARILCKGV